MRDKRKGWQDISYLSTGYCPLSGACFMTPASVRHGSDADVDIDVDAERIAFERKIYLIDVNTSLGAYVQLENPSTYVSLALDLVNSQSSLQNSEHR